MKKLLKISSFVVGFYALVILLTFGVHKCTAQTNSTFKAAESLNADSVTVRNYLRADSMANRETGWIYFNVQSNKWRLGYWSTGQPIRWQNIGAGSGSGNLSGNLTSGRIPYATALHILSDAANHTYEPGSDRELNSNDAGTQITYTYGGQTSWEEPGTSEAVIISIGNPGEPYEQFLSGGFSTTYDRSGVTSTGPLQVVSGGGHDVDITGDDDVHIGVNTAVTGTLIQIANSGSTGDGILITSATNASIVGTDSVSLQSGHAVAASEIDVTFNKITERAPRIYVSAADSIVWHADNEGVNRNFMYLKEDSLILSPNQFNTFTIRSRGIDPGGSYSSSSLLDIVASTQIRMGTALGGVEINGGIVVGNNDVSITGRLGSVISSISLDSGSGTATARLQKGVIIGDIHYGVVGSATLNFGSTLSLGETTLTTTFTNQSNGDGCLVTAPVQVGVFTCNVASGTINVVFHNTTAAPVDPASGSYKITLFK